MALAGIPTKAGELGKALWRPLPSGVENWWSTCWPMDRSKDPCWLSLVSTRWARSVCTSNTLLILTGRCSKSLSSVQSRRQSGVIGRMRRLIWLGPRRIATVTLKEALKQLKALGTAKVRAQNAKSGAGANQFGVSLGDIRVLAKKIRRDHALALSLWETENVDAQFLATLLIEPKKLSADEMDRMVRSVAFVRVADWLIVYVVRQHPEKEALRQ